MAKLPMRLRSVGTKVSEQQFAVLESYAHAQNLTLSEWVRSEILRTSDKGSAASGEVLLAELLAMRTILVNLLFALSRGQPMTAESMQELIERTDKNRARRAMERIGEGLPSVENKTKAGTEQEREDER